MKKSNTIQWIEENSDKLYKAGFTDEDIMDHVCGEKDIVKLYNNFFYRIYLKAKKVLTLLSKGKT